MRLGLKILFRNVRLLAIQWFCGRKPISVESLGSVCILAPHPDDETMGCGQLIAEICRRGGDCRVIVISGGGGSHRECCGMAEADLASARRASCRQVLETLGLPPDKLTLLDFPDGELHDHEKEIYDQVSSELSNWRGTLLVPHPCEGWSDHQAVYRVGKTLADLMRCKLFSYCVWFYYSMPFRKFGKVKWASARMLSDEFAHEKKRNALAVYRNAKAPCGKPYAGVLPELLWHAVNAEREVYFQE